MEENPWQPYQNRLAPSINIPQEVDIRLMLDDQEIDLVELLDEDVGPKPALMFLSSDEYLPFEIYLTHEADENFVILLTGDGFNPVSVSIERYDD